ncbi:MAG TPA: hypothetical protein HPP94_15045 [Desulfuromonadales bacterium]|nr:hypothetical protein [Desulfuromonadales bacterium]
MCEKETIIVEEKPNVVVENQVCKTNFLLIFLEKWMPALITAGIGGALVAILVPGIQSNYAEEAALKKRKIELWESIGSNFTYFINANFQLVTVASEIERQEKNNEIIPSTVMNRKEEYRMARDSYASKLNSDLTMASFYFGKPIKSLTGEYRKWIISIATSSIENMPPRSEFEKWRDRFLNDIGQQVKLN